MYKTFVAGAGRIGSLIASLLANSKDYEVYLVDKVIPNAPLPNLKNLHFTELDISDSQKLNKYLKQNQIEITIASLPYFNNLYIAKAACDLDLHYFDLTEDIAISEQVRLLAEGKKRAFVSQCGVAPGFINIVANYLMSLFDKVEATHLRAGCLPKQTHNALKYAITWSLDGLINEYGNDCLALIQGQEERLQPLEDLEIVELDGVIYEAFNTSGGVGSLVETYRGKVKNLNYKTLRYPGHCEKMRFLMKDLRLNEDREKLKKILEKSLPQTDQDVMLLYVSVVGEKQRSYFEQSYTKKIEPQQIHGQNWSAIQITTASSLCAVVDIVMHQVNRYQGFVLQEQFSFKEFCDNRFGKLF